MAQITPNELSEREFTRAIRGYNTAEVDEYINRIVENYAKLYRENIALTQRLAEAEALLIAHEPEEKRVRKTLETAKKAGDAVIEEAYTRADDIIASVKSNCDAILKGFRDKVEAQKKALSDIEKSVSDFKSELFEKYRLHIELIEQLTPVYELDESLTPDDYVENIVSELKNDIASQHGTGNAPEVELTTDKDAFLFVSEAAKEISQSEKSKKKKEAVPSVTSLLDEPDAVEPMFDLDLPVSFK
jgi:cell division initiation protein